MSPKKIPYEELQKKLTKTEGILKAIRRGEVDLLVGETRPLVIQYKSLVEEKERLLRETKRLAREWQTTFNAVNDAVWILDQEMRILNTNKTAERMFNVPAEEIIGRYCCEIVHGTKTPIAGCPFIQMKKSLKRETLELCHREQWFEITLDPILEGKKKLVGAVHIISDITERKKAEAEREKLQIQLDQAQKMEAIGRLAGGVAHDFNNMLTIILGYGEIMLAKLHPDDPLRPNVAEIVEAGKRSSALTRQLLAFSRKQTLQPQVLDLNAVIQNLEKMIYRLIGEDIELNLVLSRDLAQVYADPGQIEQVIMNLVVNARDAMPQGGKLFFETANIELDDSYAKQRPGVQPGKYVMLAITDSGLGMDKETLSKIFEPFFTTKERGKGTGLGLSTVYGIVKQSGGNIWAYSEPGKGTTFKIYLPQSGAKKSVKKTKSDKERPRGQGETVLVVEDELSLRELLENMLTGLGYRVITAANGDEALHLVNEKGLKPDLLITDVVMPGMGGKALAKRLQQSHPRLKVLYMSGYTDNAIVHHGGVLITGTHFLQKPFTVRNLAVKVRQALK
ncbi:MAG: hypothetical protein Kow0042_18530 [Calditrichia bacterium]